MAEKEIMGVNTVFTFYKYYFIRIADLCYYLLKVHAGDG